MGMFGKYLIEITCANGEVGYFMDIYDGCIELANHPDSAEHFMTRSGALGFADGIDWNMPAYGDRGESRIVSVDLVVLK